MGSVVGEVSGDFSAVLLFVVTGLGLRINESISACLVCASSELSSVFAVGGNSSLLEFLRVILSVIRRFFWGGEEVLLLYVSG